MLSKHERDPNFPSPEDALIKAWWKSASQTLVVCSTHLLHITQNTVADRNVFDFMLLGSFCWGGSVSSDLNGVSQLWAAAQKNCFVPNGLVLPSGQSLAVHKKLLGYKLTRRNLVSDKQCVCAYMYWDASSVCTVPAVCEELNPQDLVLHWIFLFQSKETIF